MEQIRKLPIGIQTLINYVKAVFLYVDKTAMIYQIASTSTPYFLSRPVGLARVCSFPLSKLTFKDAKTCFRAWPSNSWKRSGNSILFYILT